MDILGIGAAEILLIGLLLMIVAGPKRSAEWARLAGEQLYKLRQIWSRMMQDLRNELGDDADVFVRTAQDIQRTTSDLRSTTSTRNIVGKAMQASENMATRQKNAQPDAPKQEDTTTESRYSAWTKPVVNVNKPSANATSSDELGENASD